MRVLIVNQPMDVYGGAAQVIVKLANYLSEHKIDNTLLTTRINPEIIKDLKHTPIILETNLWFGVQKHKKFFDVINVHNIPSEFSSFLCNKPVVWMCNEPELYLINTRKSRLFLTIEKMIVNRFIDVAVVADKFNANRFESIYHKKPRIVNYGVDYNFYSKRPNNSKMRLGLVDKFVVLQVGWIQKYKNQIESVKAIEMLKNKIPNILLVLVGIADENYKAVIQRYIFTNGLEQYVKFAGNINNKKVREYYYACDVLLHPIMAQGGWLSPFEALCAKKPIVVSKEMTASKIIERERIGVVTNDYTKAILDIYKNPLRYHKIAERGNVFVRKKLNWNMFCSEMVKIFNDVVVG